VLRMEVKVPGPFQRQKFVKFNLMTNLK
jgi:hypothetical protein